MSRYPHDFVQCPKCSHVWNRSFLYDAIPYKGSPNRMFNKGSIWKGHLARTRDVLLMQLPSSPTVIEVGCGEGHFVRGVAQSLGQHGRFIGFDANGSVGTGSGIEFYPRLFEPLVDVPAFEPDAIVVRHLFEHLTKPAELLEQLAWGAEALSKPCWLFSEAPCIDRVFETDRLADFFYEHVSHFTTKSFRAFMSRAGEVFETAHGYDGEVIFALVKLGVPSAMQMQSAATQVFAQRAELNRSKIRGQLDVLAASGVRVAIWGGTGKAAAFIHQFNADAARFPLVVDSDPDKAGTFVPGTGQEILFRDALREVAVDVVIIPTQWRAKDIVAEMKREGISPGKVLIEHGGQLIDFVSERHPYGEANE